MKNCDFLGTSSAGLLFCALMLSWTGCGDDASGGGGAGAGGGGAAHGGQGGGGVGGLASVGGMGGTGAFGGGGAMGGTGGMAGVCDGEPPQGLAIQQPDFRRRQQRRMEAPRDEHRREDVDCAPPPTDLCQPNGGASPITPYPDGDAGIDNSFGKNILPILLGLAPTWTSDANNTIDQGAGTTLLDLACLPPTGDLPTVTTKLYLTTNLGMTPKWDGTDDYPVAPELLSNSSDPQSATILFPDSSVLGTTFDSGPAITFLLRIGGGVMGMDLTLHAAHFTTTLSADRKSATGGVLAGVLDTEEVVAQLKKIGYAANLCSSPLLNDLITAVRQASDIMNDGTQDPTKTCNGISIGLGFDLGAANVGSVGPTTPTAMSCQ
ncbi:MAG: hypothetical protein U0271_42635 [Polyangiaceae bacterium]